MKTYTGKELIMKNTMLLITSILVLSFWSCEEEPDTTPPDISIASPVDGAIVSDTITIKTVVADNDGINNVEFYLDGDLLATVSEEPFQTEWNTSESSNGEHTLQCKAVDNSDNETLSESIQVTVAMLYLLQISQMIGYVQIVAKESSLFRIWMVMFWQTQLGQEMPVLKSKLLKV